MRNLKTLPGSLTIVALAVLTAAGVTATATGNDGVVRAERDCC